MENELSVELTLDTEKYKSDLASALAEFNKFQKELSSKKLNLNRNQIREFDSIFTDIKNTAIRELNTVQNKINDLEINSDKISASWDRALKNLDTSLPIDKFNERLSKIDEIEVKFDMNEEALKDAEDRYQGLMELLQENPLEMKYNDEAFAKFNVELDNVADGLSKSGQKMDELKKKSSGLSSIFGRFSIAGRIFSQMRTSIATMLNPMNYVRKLWNDIIMADGSNLGNTFKTVGENLKNYLTPILQKVAVAILNVISYLAQMISIITGKKIDLFKKSKDSTDKIKKNMAGTAKSAKQVNRQLASGFDEITDISESVSGGGGGGGSLSPVTQPIDFKFNEPKLPKVLENIAKWIRDNPKFAGILAGITTFTLLGGWKVASGLGGAISTLLGHGGAAPTGLLGLQGLLVGGALAGAAYLTWNGFDLLGHHISGVKELKDEMKALEEQQERLNDMTHEVSVNNMKQANSFVEKAKAGEIDNKMMNTQLSHMRNIIKDNARLMQSDNLTANAKKDLQKENEKVVNTYAELYKQGLLTDDQEKQYYDFIKNTFPLGLQSMNGKLKDTADNFKELDKKYNTKYQIDMKEEGAKDVQKSVDNVKSSVEKLSEKWKNIADKVAKGLNITIKGDKVASYAVGTNYVPNDQLAYIHKGEAIIPKKYNNEDFVQTHLNSSETNSLLKTLITAVNNIDINPYTTVKDVGSTAVQYIKDKERQMGRSVI